MTADRKRLRELAQAHIRNRVATHYEGCEADHWRCCMAALLDALEAAEQETKWSEDARDAARYRWLRDHDDDEVVERTVRVSRQMAGYKWNDAIDAAIREQENHDAA